MKNEGPTAANLSLVNKVLLAARENKKTEDSCLIMLGYPVIFLTGGLAIWQYLEHKHVNAWLLGTCSAVFVVICCVAYPFVKRKQVRSQKKKALTSIHPVDGVTGSQLETLLDLCWILEQKVRSCRVLLQTIGEKGAPTGKQVTSIVLANFAETSPTLMRSLEFLSICQATAREIKDRSRIVSHNNNMDFVNHLLRESYKGHKIGINILKFCDTINLDTLTTSKKGERT